MSIGSFFKLVEIQTKIASMTPFLLGTFYALYRFDSFRPLNLFLMLISLLCIDMATTTVNNYQDYRTARRKHGFGYESHNAIVRDNLPIAAVHWTIGILLAIAVGAGILLVFNTNMVVLLLGAASFATGLLYTSGPVPISRTPYGEIYSGGFMGLIIPLIAVYIHVFDENLISLTLHGGTLTLQLEALEVLWLVLLSLPAATGIANIMLANNICDIEDDLENRRYTLPIYLGKQNALRLFSFLYYLGYAGLIVALIAGAAPLVSALTLLTVIIVRRNVARFNQEQLKSTTFALSVQNFAVVNLALTLTLAIAAIAPRIV